MNRKRVMFASSEVYPFVKTGGLADVSYSLPKALEEWYDVSVVSPLYAMIDRDRYRIVLKETFETVMGTQTYPIELYEGVYEQRVYRFIYTPLLCDREFLYGPPESGYEDNGLRFALFSHALVELVRRYPCEVLHLNDWQCALSALVLKADPTLSTRSLFTIHNLAYQGVFPSSLLPLIGIDEANFTMEGIEFYDQISFIKAGIAHAEAVTTVSPTYAKEILTPQFGCALEGFVQHHKHKLVGILNGLDRDHFSPENDTALVECYTTVKGKKSSKSDLLKSLKLKGATKPLLVFIGRLTHQKGVEILIEALPKIAETELNIVVLGEGEKRYQERLEQLCDEHKNIRFFSGYDESFSHRLYAAADFVLIPSLFEPCGLNQLIGYAYGAMPIVSRVGGLADTVKKADSFDPQSTSGFGIVLSSPTSRALVSAVKKGCELYEDKKRFDSIVTHNMQCDYSWSESAKSYAKLYTRLIK